VKLVADDIYRPMPVLRISTLDRGLAHLKSCPVCPVTDGTDWTEPMMRPDRGRQMLAGPGHNLCLSDRVSLGRAGF